MTEEDLSRMFDEFNAQYFGGRLRKYRALYLTLS